MLQIEDLNQKFEEFEMACKTILPGVDRRLIEDLILHQQEDPIIEYITKLKPLLEKGQMSVKSKRQYWLKQV